jgi:acylphosphatase
MRREAQALRVFGWVRNCDDGTVEAVVHGGADAVEAIVRWAHEGPRGARVSRVDVEPETGAWSGFEIRYD